MNNVEKIFVKGAVTKQERDQLKAHGCVVLESFVLNNESIITVNTPDVTSG